jgi:hypothetical protein
LIYIRIWIEETYHLLYEQYEVFIKVHILRDASVIVYQYWRHPLLLAQGNTENNKLRILHVFTHPIMNSNGLNVLFITTTILDDTNNT